MVYYDAGESCCTHPRSRGLPLCKHETRARPVDAIPIPRRHGIRNRVCRYALLSSSHRAQRTLTAHRYRSPGQMGSLIAQVWLQRRKLA